MVGVRFGLIAYSRPGDGMLPKGMSADSIRQAVQEKLSLANDRRREAELLEAEARGMEAALALFMGRGTAIAARKQSDMASEIVGHAIAAMQVATSKIGGRQPGALSNRWKRNLLDLKAQAGAAAFSIQDVITTVERVEGRQIRSSEARRQLDSYVEYGHVHAVGAGLYQVPDDVAARFRASLKHEDDGVEYPQTNEAADTKPSGAESAASITGRATDELPSFMQSPSARP